MLEQMQSSTQRMFQQMLLQMQTLSTSISTKLGDFPKPEVSATEKPPEVKIPQVTAIVTTNTKKKGELFPFAGEAPKFGFNKLRGILLSMTLRRMIV